MTVGIALQHAVAGLASLSDAPQIDAERLLLYVLDQSEIAWLYSHSDQSLTPLQEEYFRKLVAERATGKPLAYILGEWEFYGRPFYVTPDVLIPRPETENLVEAALAYLSRSSPYQGEGLTIADIGTGSGCIAVTLVLELGMRNMESRILATDISPAALAIAKKSAERHGVLEKIEFLEGDMLTPLAGQKIDLIVSNPPYIPTAELAEAGNSLKTKGLTFEPQSALDGGPDGQKFVKQIKNAGVPALVESTNGEILSFFIN